MRELEGLGVFRTVWRAKVRQREGHVREPGRLLRTRTRQVHTVQEPERLWASYTVRELDRLLGAVTRQVHTVLLQRTLLKSPTTT